MLTRALPAVVASIALLSGCRKDAPAPVSPAAPAVAPAAAPPAPPAASAVLVAPGTQPALAALATSLVGSSEPAARGTAIVAGLRAKTSLLPTEGLLGRDPLDPESAAKSLGALTGIECGALAAALLRAVGQEPGVSVVFPDGAGRTSFRHRAIAVTVEGKPTLACGELSSGVASAPLDTKGETAQFLGLAALRLAEQQDVEKAVAKVIEAKGLAPDDGAVLFLDGQLKAIRGEVDDGLEQMEKAVADAEDSEGLFQLAVAYLRADERFSAFRSLEKAVKLFPKHTRALSALASLQLERRQEVPEDQRATVDAELDRIEKSLLAVGPDAPGLVELRIQRLRVVGKVDEALKLALDAANTVERASLRMLLADMAKASGDSAAAELHLAAAAKADPLDAEPLIQLAQLQADRGDIDKTVATLSDAVRRAPHDVDLLANYANLLMQLGRTDEASKVATELKNRFPEAADGYALLAQLALQGGNVAGANDLLEQAIAKNEKSGDLYVMLYIGYVMGGTPEKAAGVVDRLMKHDPEGRMRIAQALLQTGQIDGASGLLEQELEARPESLEVAITLAQIYALSEKTEAVARLRKAVEGRGNAEDLKTFDDALVELKKRAEEAEKGEQPGGFPMVEPEE